MTNHDGRRALVTGASRGIGAAIAAVLADRGFRVSINYRKDEEGAHKVLELLQSRGHHGELTQFDVADAEQTQAALVALGYEDDPFTVVVNNAGMVADAAFPALEADGWYRVVRTTLDGFYHVTRPLVMPMVRQRWGRIVNISSVSALLGPRGQTNYAAAKAGLVGATKSLARELAKRKITVNAVAPGLIETAMIQDVPVEEAMHMIPMRRLGQPHEVANLVGFLCSDEAAYITGQVIAIDGGMS